MATVCAHSIAPRRRRTWTPGVEWVSADVRDLGAVRAACREVDTVFHTAAVLDFATYPSPARAARAWAVNVTGVENVVQAARECGVTRLVHTSSNNVTLDGPVEGGRRDHAVRRGRAQTSTPGPRSRGRRSS